MVQSENQNGLKPVQVPVPPMLPEAFGYVGRGKLLAIWYEPQEKIIFCCDGRRLLFGGSTTLWWKLVRHPVLEKELRPHALTSSSSAREMSALLLDRRQEGDPRLYVGKYSEVLSAVLNAEAGGLLDEMYLPMLPCSKARMNLREVEAWLNRRK
jgi:hypothetical protein